MLRPVLVTFLVIQTITGNILPKNGRTFTSQVSWEGQNMLANNLQFLCSFKSQDGSDWTQALQDSILAQISNPKDNADDYAMKKTLTENIITNAMSNCDSVDVILSDQPEKGWRQAADTNYIENILQNLFSGNIRGIIQSYTGRSTERVSTTVSDIFRSLLTNISTMRSGITSLGSLMGRGGANATTEATNNKVKV